MVLKILRYILSLPLYMLSFLWIKEENLWVFGAWAGQRYSDNSKYVFEYVQEHEGNIRAVWLSRRKEIVQKLRSEGHEAYLITSFKGYIIGARASVYFFTDSLFDVGQLCSGKGLKFQLWHGIPLKKIGFDSNTNLQFDYKSKITKILFPFYDEWRRWDYINSSSEYVSKVLQTAFGKGKEQVVINGSPRNDIILKAKETAIISKVKKDNKDSKIIGYFPTFRENEDFLSKTFDESFYQLNEVFESINLTLLVKVHFRYINELLLDQVKYSRIIFLKEDECEDINYLLPHLDLIITDYSSVFYDYLILDRPIIFTPFDLETYSSKDKGLYEDYFKATPGVKCFNWDEVGLMMKENFGNQNDEYKERRMKVRLQMNHFVDMKNCERIVEFVKKVI